MEILIIILLILLNGVFAMAEMSLVSTRKFKLESAERKGSKGAKTALKLSKNPTKFLSTIQIGITLIGILLGVYSGKNLTDDVAGVLIGIELLQPYAQPIATAIIVVIVTYFSIVLGELLPKRLGMTFPEPIAIILAKPMQILSYITSPFVWLLSATNDLLLNVLGIKRNRETKVSEEEIKSIIKESADGGEIQNIEQDIVERVFELGDRRINTLFTHRSEIAFLNSNDSLEEIQNKVNADKHSVYPVCKDNNLDVLLGVVLLKDLFSIFSDKNFALESIIKEPLYFDENTYAYRVLELFKKEKKQHAIVIDEYGTTQGIVTMDDVVDALVGDATEDGQDEYQITQRNDSSWLVDGQYSIFEFVKYFGIKLNEDFQNKFTTVAGFIIYTNNSLPEVGEKFIYDNYELEIIDKDGQRIDKIMVTRIDSEL